MSNQVHVCALIALVFSVGSADAVAATTVLPHPLKLADVTAIAVGNRAEISAANARADALAQRPAIVSALEDPVISVSIDHYPYEMMESGRRYDRSVSVEQSFPLSRVRSHREAAAIADALRGKALAGTTQLEVVLDAQRSFFMLLERRRMQPVLEEQLLLARQLVSVAASRYASGAGMQSEVLRAEVEVARLQATREALAAKVRASEFMLNTSMGLPPQSSVPELQYRPNLGEPASEDDVLARATASRPELFAGAAEVDRAKAELQVMRSMYKPMAMVRIGQATTMEEGSGAMLMVGLSVPIWRNRLNSGVAEARAMERMANADLEAMRRMVASEALAAREQVNAARTQALALETDVLPRAQSATDASLASYASGKGTLVSVIESARSLWDVQAEKIMVESAVGEAWAKLDRAMGKAQEPSQ